MRVRRPSGYPIERDRASGPRGRSRKRSRGASSVSIGYVNASFADAPQAPPHVRVPARERDELLVMEPWSDFHTREIARGCMDVRALSSNWSLSLSPNPPHLEAPVLSDYPWLAGLIMHAVNLDLATHLTGLGVPVVNTSPMFPDLPCPLVTVDSREAGRIGGRHFLDKGFSDYAFCLQTGSVDQELLFRGFHHELQRGGHTCSKFTLMPGLRSGQPSEE